MAEPLSGPTHAPAASTIPPQLYALVDMARAPQLLPLIEWLGRSGTAQCLFEGSIDESLRRASPHIVALARAQQLLDRWLAEGHGQSWGVFLETPLPLHLARRHVRRFLQVALPDGSGPVMMRFWDPRVLGGFLESADEDWRNRLFANICSYLVERDDRLIRVTLAGGRVRFGDGAAWLAGGRQRDALPGAAVRERSVAAISDQQYARLSSAYAKNLEREISPIVRQIVPNIVQDRDDLALADFVHGAASRGRSFGFDTTRQIVRYCIFEAMFGAGPEGAAAMPGALAILRQRDLPGGERLDQLAAIAIAHNAETGGVHG